MRRLSRLVKNHCNVPQNDIFTHVSLTAAYSWAGHQEEARSQANEILQINPAYNIKKAEASLLYKNKEDLERDLVALRKAGIPE